MRRACFGEADGPSTARPGAQAQGSTSRKCDSGHLPPPGLGEAGRVPGGGGLDLKWLLMKMFITETFIFALVSPDFP